MFYAMAQWIRPFSQPKTTMKTFAKLLLFSTALPSFIASAAESPKETITVAGYSIPVEFHVKNSAGTSFFFWEDYQKHIWFGFGGQNRIFLVKNYPKNGNFTRLLILPPKVKGSQNRTGRQVTEGRYIPDCANGKLTLIQGFYSNTNFLDSNGRSEFKEDTVTLRTFSPKQGTPSSIVLKYACNMLFK